jgi:predicted nuclease with TOPRIM domain
MLILTSCVVTQTCFGFQHDGNTVLSDNCSPVDSLTEDCPLPPPPQEAGKQTVAFTFSKIYGYLTFPDECHPGDNTTHSLIAAVEAAGVYLDFFTFSIACDTPCGQETLHCETIEDQDLPETWILNETVTLNIPADADGKVHCIIDTETCPTFHGKIELDTTNIRTLTYQELQTAYNNLLDQYNATLEELQQWKNEYQNLNDTYINLSGLYNATVEELERWKTEYQLLNSTYSDLSDLYNATDAELQSLKTEYQNLNSTYNNLLSQHNATLEQLNQWKTQFNTLNSTYNELLMNYSSLNSTYQKLQSDYNTLKSSYDSLNANYTSLNNSYNSLQQNYNALLTKYDDLTSKYNQLNSTYQQLVLNYTVLLQSNQELTSNLTSLQAQYDNLSTSYNMLNSTYYSLLHETENSKIQERRLWATIALLITLVALAIAAAVCVAYVMKKKNN